MFLDTFQPSRYLVLAGGAILPAPAVPASTRIFEILVRVEVTNLLIVRAEKSDLNGPAMDDHPPSL